jgi:hypothetical protein
MNQRKGIFFPSKQVLGCRNGFLRYGFKDEKAKKRNPQHNQKDQKDPKDPKAHKSQEGSGSTRTNPSGRGSTRVGGSSY